MTEPEHKSDFELKKDTTYLNLMHCLFSEFGQKIDSNIAL